MPFLSDYCISTHFAAFFLVEKTRTEDHGGHHLHGVVTVQGKSHTAPDSGSLELESLIETGESNHTPTNNVRRHVFVHPLTGTTESASQTMSVDNTDDMSSVLHTQQPRNLVVHPNTTSYRHHGFSYAHLPENVNQANQSTNGRTLHPDNSSETLLHSRYSANDNTDNTKAAKSLQAQEIARRYELSSSSQHRKQDTALQNRSKSPNSSRPDKKLYAIRQQTKGPTSQQSQSAEVKDERPSSLNALHPKRLHGVVSQMSKHIELDKADHFDDSLVTPSFRKEVTHRSTVPHYLPRGSSSSCVKSDANIASASTVSAALSTASKSVRSQNLSTTKKHPKLPNTKSEQSEVSVAPPMDSILTVQEAPPISTKPLIRGSVNTSRSPRAGFPFPPDHATTSAKVPQQTNQPMPCKRSLYLEGRNIDEHEASSGAFQTPSDLAKHGSDGIGMSLFL